MGLLSFLFYKERHSELESEHRLQTNANLQRILAKERARADRTGEVVSWVVFRLRDEQASKYLARIVGKRARETDAVGWLVDTDICAILPATDLAGARSFAASVARLASAEYLHPEVLIYSYPLDPPPGTKRPPRLAHSGNDGLERRAPSIELPDTPTIQCDVCHPYSNKDHFVIHMPWWKRCFDLIGASAGIILTAPLIIGAAIAVRISSRGPIFFAQQRAGTAGRPFTMYKFRSMYIGSEARKAALVSMNEQDGPAFKIKNDPRVTPIGRILRQLSIDELPQLLNVLRGEMSLVGPRPPTFDEVAKYRMWYGRRLDVTPGITCIWQVRGRARVTFENWMRMDLQYIQNYSLRQDVELIFATIPAVLLRRGAY